MEHSIKEISEYRYNRCEETLHSAEILQNKGRYTDSLDRSFFSFFNGVRSIITFDGIESIEHSKVIGYFIENHINKGIFANETAEWLKDALESKEKEDLLDFYYPTEEESKIQIERVKAFKEDVRKYLVLKGVLEDKN